MGLYELTERLGRIDALDGLGKTVAGAVARVFPHGPVKDVLSGTWLGHSVHPMLTDVPIGAWLSAGALDVLGDESTDTASEILIGVGLVASLPTMAAGLSDWSDTIGSERRIGFVHGGSNVVVSLLYASSLWARRRGNRSLGVSLGLIGAGVTAASAYLGGHLSLAMGVGVDHTAFEHGPMDWTTVMPESDLGDEPRAVDVEDTTVMLVRRGGTIAALANRCSHLGGPLSEGELGDGTVTCPWHQSTFALVDGSIVTGPARAPQPAYDVRVEDGGIQIKARAPAH